MLKHKKKHPMQLNEMSDKTLFLIFGIIASVLFVFLLLILSPFTLVSAGHRTVLTRFGQVQEQILSEGFHLISPFDSTHEYDVRTQKDETDSNAASKDLQNVSTKIAVNFHVNPDKVKALFQETQGKYQSTLIDPAIQESVKAATAQFTADELITKRHDVKEAIKTALKERESMKFFIVEDVSIVNFSFSDSFNNAIESKVRAEQDALASKNKLEQTKYEAEQKLVTARAEAESIKIQAQAITSQGGSDYVQLQAINKWNGELPAQMIPGSTVPFINLTK